MGFRKLLEISDKIAKEELGDYYIISKSRMDNYIHCLESGAEQIRRLKDENEKLRARLPAHRKSLPNNRSNDGSN